MQTNVAQVNLDRLCLLKNAKFCGFFGCVCGDVGEEGGSLNLPMAIP